MIAWFRNTFRPNPGRELGRIGPRRHKAKVRARVDEMRQELGLDPVKWGRL